MKAVQCWALLNFVDLLFAPTFTAGMVTYLRELIADHLSLFLYCAGDNVMRLKPKHHLIIHLPTVILQSGTLVGTNRMRYELKYSSNGAYILCAISPMFARHFCFRDNVS